MSANELQPVSPFGARCTVMMHENDITGNKCRSRSYKGIMVGYGDPFGMKGWRVYVPSLRRVVTSVNVRFLHNMDESIAKRPPELIDLSSVQPWSTRKSEITTTPPEQIGQSPPAPVSTAPSATTTQPAPSATPHPKPASAETVVQPTNATRIDTVDEHTKSIEDGNMPKDNMSNDTTHVVHDETYDTSASTPTHDTSANSQRPSSPRRSKRTRNTSYVPPSALEVQEGPQHLSRKLAKAKKRASTKPSSPKRLQREIRAVRRSARIASRQHSEEPLDSSIASVYFASMRRISERKALVAMSTDPFAGDIRLPATYKEAIMGIHAKYWRKALKEEIASLRKHKVFKLVSRSTLPRGANKYH